MTATAAPISAAAEQQHQHDDNQDQFHWISPLMAMAVFARQLSIQRPIQSIVPDSGTTGCRKHLLQKDLFFTRPNTQR
jgi:hypothetical protein